MDAQEGKIEVCQPATNGEECEFNPNAPGGVAAEIRYARADIPGSPNVATCYDQFMALEQGNSVEAEAIRCYSPSTGRGVTADASGGARADGCTGTWAEAKAWCEALSITMNDPGNSGATNAQLNGAQIDGVPVADGQVVDDWRLARAVNEAGACCGSGCQSDFVPAWVEFDTNPPTTAPTGAPTTAASTAAPTAAPTGLITSLVS